MFHMSRKDEDFATVMGDLHLVPISISYEYDPCDQAKARELYIRATTGSYSKAPGEDDASIALGITGHKGRVHIDFNAEVTAPDGDAKLLAQRIDRSILGNYHLFPVNYLAYAMWEERDPQLQVPAAAELFDAAELARAEAEWQRRLDACPPEQRPYLVMQYANPVRNQYRCRAGQL
jgi:hypothetical protein